MPENLISAYILFMFCVNIPSNTLHRSKPHLYKQGVCKIISSWLFILELRLHNIEIVWINPLHRNIIFKYM